VCVTVVVCLCVCVYTQYREIFLSSIETLCNVELHARKQLVCGYVGEICNIVCVCVFVAEN